MLHSGSDMNIFKRYSEIENYIMEQLPMYQRVGKVAYKADLTNTIKLMELTKFPFKNFSTIHVGGTNGKGSVSHLLASILQEAGYKTGLFTSPHLKDFRERIKVNGQLIEKNYIKKFFNTYYENFLEIKPSFFEISVALAFSYFRDKKVDVAVIEVGLGGRLDSTNVIHPIMSIITHIAYDHMDLLGDTLEKIAIEKAGIIKPKTPILIGRKQDEISHVFETKAKETEAPLYYASNYIKKFDRRPENALVEKTNIFVETHKNIYLTTSPLTGWYQKENIQTAIVAAEMIPQFSTLRIEKKHIESGINKVIQNTHFMGRWFIRKNKVPIIFDVAHNEEGIKEITCMLKSLQRRSLHIVLGMVNDKDHFNMLKHFPSDAIYYFCSPSVPRALEVDRLIQIASQFDLKGKAYSSVCRALSAAIRKAQKNDVIFVGGSTFTVAEAI
ncbi:MAG: bifunctional folylpolyglutamate synthase/dihydrofolate synthase [Bacteroidales bacterium]|nr:bifunctional folylpolyglutamate synthase/dihydrofolate synthase [Bacteroidales bacterium]